MIILHDPDTLLHETIELLGARTIPALESPDRIKAILDTVSSSPSSNHDLRIIASPTRATNTAEDDSQPLHSLLDIIGTTHDAGYLQHIRSVFKNWLDAKLITPSETVLPECFVLPNSARSIPRIPTDIYARAGYYAFDMSSGIMSQTYASTIASANLAYQATLLVNPSSRASNEEEVIFALCRPPGHHCDGRRAGGYCYVNNAAVAVSTWQALNPENRRVGILDIDFHHGNGTQEIYYNDPSVFYTSIHGEDEFPYYTGMADEVGGPDAQGFNLNLPLKTRSSVQAYLENLDIALNGLRKFGPEFLVVSLGFDTFYLDPLGCFEIETEDYRTIAHAIRAKLHGMSAVILLEGGYVLEHLGSNVLSFIQGWEEAVADPS